MVRGEVLANPGSGVGWKEPIYGPCNLCGVPESDGVVHAYRLRTLLMNSFKQLHLLTFDCRISSQYNSPRPQHYFVASS